MWRRILGLGAALSTFFTPVQAQPSGPVSARSAPAAWMGYAKQVETQFESGLGGDSEPAKRLRTYLANVPGGSGAVAVRAWVDPHGTVSRVAFAPFLDSQANADLTNLLQSAHLGNPPAGILLPIRLNLHIAAPSGAGDASATVR